MNGYSPDVGFVGNIDFYDNFQLVETYQIKELHGLGVSVVRKPYGAVDSKPFFVNANTQAVDNKISGLKDKLM
ncbi:MAG: hypothetical protein ACXWF8_01670 [Methylobacter sp.]